MPSTKTSQSIREADLSFIAIVNAIPVALGSQMNETVSPVAMLLVIDPHFQYIRLCRPIKILKLLMCLPVEEGHTNMHIRQMLKYNSYEMLFHMKMLIEKCIIMHVISLSNQKYSGCIHVLDSVLFFQAKLHTFNIAHYINQ